MVTFIFAVSQPTFGMGCQKSGLARGIRRNSFVTDPSVKFKCHSVRYGGMTSSVGFEEENKTHQAFDKLEKFEIEKKQ